MKTKYAHVDGVCNHCGVSLSEDWCAYIGKVCQSCIDKLEEESHQLDDEED